jgi:hypothetical protein
MGWRAKFIPGTFVSVVAQAASYLVLSDVDGIYAARMGGVLYHGDVLMIISDVDEDDAYVDAWHLKMQQRILVDAGSIMPIDDSSR